MAVSSTAARCAGSGTPCTPQWRSRRWRAGRYPPPACPGTRCTSSRRWRRDSRTSGAAAPRHRACPGRPPACRCPSPSTTAATRRRSGSTGSGGCPHQRCVLSCSSLQTLTPDGFPSPEMKRSANRPAVCTASARPASCPYASPPTSVRKAASRSKVPAAKPGTSLMALQMLILKPVRICPTS